MSNNTLLRAINIDKSYAGVHALNQASFELRAEEVHALIGENGAGKSTLIKIITGAVLPDSGTIQLNGTTIAQNSPRVAKQLGIAAMYQQPALFPELSVAENIAIGLEESSLLSRVNWRNRKRKASELLARVGANIDPDAEAGELTLEAGGETHRLNRGDVAAILREVGHRWINSGRAHAVIYSVTEGSAGG